MKSGLPITLLKIVLIVLFIILVTLAAIASYLLYKNNFNSLAFSNWMFYAAIAYVALAIVPLYDVITSSNSASFTYGEYAVKGKIENHDRVNEALSNRSPRFSIIMITAGILLFLGSSIVERLF